MIGTAHRVRPSPARAVWLAVGIAPIALLLLRQPAFSLVSPGFAWTLCLIAIAAELLAIDTGPRAPRFSLAPVYIGAIAWFWSPGLSVGIAASAILLGSLASRRLWSQFTLDLATNFAGLVVASLAILLIPRAHLGSDFAGVGVAVFVCVYAVVQSLSRSILTRSRGENFTVSFPRLLDSPSPAVCAVALLCAVVAVLSRDGLTWVLPFTLVPILALRLGVLRQHQLSESYYDTVTALSLMLQRAHPNTHDHLDRVSRTAELVAQQLGLSASRAQLVRAAAVLHDIGKIAVDEAVLDKPGPLTVAERAHVENHAVWGAQILSPVQRFQELIPWIRHHHERQDGTGYPDRLSGDQIPIESKIIAVVDAFDAMTCRDRPYRSPLTQDEAILELQRCATTQFDSAVVQAFAEILAGGNRVVHLVTIVVLAVAAVTTGALALYVFYYLPRTMERHLQEALKAFSMAVELRFPSHRGLSARVFVLSRTVGLELGLDAKRLTNLEMATSLRDIGLCAIPYGLVNERHPKAWTDEEASEYERHGEVSGSMLEMVPRLAHLAPIVGNHHVAFASGGALRAPIPLEASILNVVTAYLWAERLQSDLLARDALITQSGTTYDPRVVDALLRVLPSVRVGVSEPASLVRICKRLIVPLVLLLLAVLIRLPGITWGLKDSLHNQSFHPDEELNFRHSREIEPAHLSFIAAPQGYPDFYSYGTLYLTTMRIVDDVMFGYGGGSDHPNDDWDYIRRGELGGRIISLLAGSLLCVVVYFTCKRFTTELGAIAAALTLAVAPALVVHSRFATVDVFATLFVALSGLYAVKLLLDEDPKWRKLAILAGVCVGLSAGTKYAGGLGILMPLLALAIRRPPKALILGSVTVLSSVVAFVVSTPGCLLDTAKFVKDVEFEATHVRQGHGMVFTGTSSGYFYHLSNLCLGVGMILLFLGLGALVWAIWQKKTWAWVLLAFALPYYLTIGSAEVKFMRYVFPLTVAIAAGVGYAVGEGHRLGKGYRALVAVGILGLGGIEGGGLRGAGFFTMQMATGMDNREKAGLDLKAEASRLPDEENRIGSKPAPGYVPPPIKTDVTVGLISDPWFWSPTLYPDITRGLVSQRFKDSLMRQGQKPQVVRFEPEDGSLPIQYDPRLVTDVKPDYIAYSDFEAMYMERVMRMPTIPDNLAPDVERYKVFKAALEKDYKPWREYGDWEDMVEDMRYVMPSLIVWQRKS